MRKRWKSVQLLSICSLLGASLALAAKPGGGGGSPPPPVGFRYEKVDLGTLGGSWSVANGMNNLGDVVGLSGRADGSQGPFVYFASTGQMHDVNSLILNSSLNSPKQLVFGPDGNLYVSSGASDEVEVYDGTTGEVLGDFVPAGSSPLDNPHGMAFLPDGDLLVTSRSTDEVLRYDGASGAFVGAFVSAGSGGIDDPINLAFGPDGNLYVTSHLTNEVLTYSGTDGSFLGVFVSAGSGGLDWPHSLVFEPDGDLLVSGYFSGNVLRYDGTTGEFLEIVAGAGSGNAADPLDDPTGLVFGPDGDLYVAHSNGDQVLRYDGDTGAYLGVFVDAQSGPLSFPVALQFDADDNLLIVSRNTAQVLGYQGPFAADPGAYRGVFSHGSPWILDSVSDINDAGQIVGGGRPQGKSGDTTPGVYLLNPPAAGETFGSIVNLGAPAIASSNQNANAINADGDIAGWFSDASAAFHAFLYTAEDGFIDLGRLNATHTFAYGLSDRSATGQVTIVGDWAAHEQAWRAVCTPGAIGGGIALQPLGSLFSDRRTPGESAVFSVNNAGQIVGYTTTGRSDTCAARYTASGGWVSLGTLAPSTATSWNDSEARSINDGGYTVGQSMVGDVNAVPNMRAFIHADAIGIRDLASLVDGLSDAGVLGLPAAINNYGVICGPYVTNFTGVETKQAYVLVPYVTP